jgi:dihydroxyacetone kinase-like predicted kinase
MDAVHQELSRFRYCTGFVVEGRALDSVSLEETLGRLGDSLLVVGDESALKVHVHTDDPGAALSAATAVGVIDEVEIADMHAQTAAREARLAAADAALPALETGVVAVVQGLGNRAIFEAERATVVDAGQTANPTVGEIADAIEATPADAVIVLPNNSNVILAASEAASISEKDVRVLPSRSVQAGLAAIIAYVSTNSIDENEARMREALRGVATGEVTVALRDVEIDGVDVREGAYLGLVDGAAVSCQDAFEDAASSVVDRVLDGERTHLDIIVGDGAPAVEELVAGIRRTHPDLEVEVHDGGQPHYPLLVVAE